jgi:hypothetical protein
MDWNWCWDRATRTSPCNLGSLRAVDAGVQLLHVRARFLVLSFQDYLPINPDGKPGLEPTLAFNTAISFITNTNLQHYSGEVSLSYFSQLSLMWLQFVSAATGIAALVAVARAMAGSKSMGDFYQRCCHGFASGAVTSRHHCRALAWLSEAYQ